MSQRRCSTARCTRMAEHRTTLRSQRVARAVKLAEVAESFAARTVEEFGFPFFPGRLSLGGCSFGGLPFGGVKIRSAIVGDGWYPGVMEGAGSRLHARDVGGDARAEGVVYVGNVGGGNHLCGGGECEIGVWGWGPRVALAAAEKFVSGLKLAEVWGKVPLRTVKYGGVGD